MEKNLSLSKAARRMLFRASGETHADRIIPGAGSSAARCPERHSRVKVTMNIDGDIVRFFKERAKEQGLPYQTLMNQILREHVSGNRVERIANDVAQELLEDEEFLIAVAERMSGGK